MDKAQPESQMPSDTPAASAVSDVESSVKQAEDTKPTVSAVDESSKKQADEPAAASTPAPTETGTSNDEEKTIKQEPQDEEAKPGDGPPTEDKPENDDDAAAENKPSYLTNNPALGKLFDNLPSILEKTGHPEMWGVTLKDSSHVPTVNVLIKFLRANEGDVKLAEEQLSKALEWRKKMDPLALTETARFDKTKFGGLGYVTNYNQGKGVFTWNIYGAVTDINGTFGDVDEFIKWRVALMELAIRELKLNESTAVIDYDGVDPYQMFQVHDYQNVSFFRMNPTIRAASRTTIEVFSMAYPELLKEKFFVNVPAIMGWMFAAMKVFLSKNTTRKFHPIANGVNLAREFPDLGDAIPKTYGGKGGELQENAKTVVLEEKAAPEPTSAAEESGTAAQADTTTTDATDNK